MSKSNRANNRRRRTVEVKFDKSIVYEPAPDAVKEVTANGLPWFVIRTEPTRDAKAEAEITRLGLVAFSPKATKTIILRKAKIERSRPLMPGYLFVAAQMAVVDVRGLDGVIGWLMFDGAMARVSAPQMQRLIDALELQRSRAAGFTLSINDLVEISEGPLSGQQGRVVSFAPQGLAVVQLRTVRATTRPEALAKVG